mmetsp:Transcript_7836/g.22505  ORF Transcript_7836/g.22505 Transcript_7836/m.22505 type:complete len:119 (+) Transcript_7836:70-426(+)
MILGRIAAASRAAAAGSVAGLAGKGFVRNSAYVSSPKPLTIRGDSLMFQCVVAALVYFVPQDAVFLGGFFYKLHSDGASIAPKTKVGNGDAAVSEWAAKKGLQNVKVQPGRSTWYVTL